MKLLFGQAKENLMYLAMLALVMTASTVLVHIPVRAVYEEVGYEAPAGLSPLPILKSTGAIPMVTAQGVLVQDLDSAVVLFEKGADLEWLPASTTKLMTAVVALEEYSLDDVLKVGGVKVDGQKMKLVWGEEITVRDLIEGLLIFSANDAAEVLAQNYPGGRERFIAEMNKKAVELRMERTRFANPTGLDDGGQVSSARDMVRLAEVALRDPFISQAVATKEKVVKSSDGIIEHKLVNINELVGEVEGVLGVKTGWTENAHENLITYVERDGKKVMIALLGSQDRFGETRKLIEWVFDNYEWREIQSVAL